MNSIATANMFSLRPSGPFDLANQSRYFGGWPTLPNDPAAVVIAFPIENSDRAAAVVLRQTAEGSVTGAVHGCPEELVGRAWRQTLEAISLDIDGEGWPAVGGRDPVIGELQAKYRYLRPTLFHSPYEAAAAFVIGHRISIKQARALRARIAAEHGTAIELGGERFYAFPAPGQLLAAGGLPSVNQIKLDRLRAIARAAEEGWLTREQLRALPEEDALARLRTLPGIGPFFAQGILHRGAGSADGLTVGQITPCAITSAYGLKTPAGQELVRAIAQMWRPYRMWTVVLLHVWARNELRLPAGSGSARRPLATAQRPDREAARRQWRASALRSVSSAGRRG